MVRRKIIFGEFSYRLLSIGWPIVKTYFQYRPWLNQTPRQILRQTYHQTCQLHLSHLDSPKLSFRLLFQFHFENKVLKIVFEVFSKW